MVTEETLLSDDCTIILNPYPIPLKITDSDQFDSFIKLIYGKHHLLEKRVLVLKQSKSYTVKAEVKKEAKHSTDKTEVKIELFNEVLSASTAKKVNKIEAGQKYIPIYDRNDTLYHYAPKLVRRYRISYEKLLNRGSMLISLILLTGKCTNSKNPILKMN